jgi:hypothetical protein
VLFSALALIAYQASKRLPTDYERLAIAAARTSLLLINSASGSARCGVIR